MPVRFRIACITWADRSSERTSRKYPLSEDARPTGVRTASMTTAFLIGKYSFGRECILIVCQVSLLRPAWGADRTTHPSLPARSNDSVGSNRLPRCEYFASFSTTAPRPRLSHQRRMPP